MKKRLFIAIDLPLSLKQTVANYQEALRKHFEKLRVSWEKMDKFHLTLKFLGETDEAQLESLQAIVREITEKLKSFQLQISGTGVFPNINNPRVLWIGLIDEESRLGEIKRDLENMCEKIGFLKEKRAYTPHLTIARIREPQKSKGLAQRHLENKFEPASFHVSEIVIYESRLQPTGSVYLPVFKSGFGII
jgi:2'-5' RNA ligase